MTASLSCLLSVLYHEYYKKAMYSVEVFEITKPPRLCRGGFVISARRVRSRGRVLPCRRG